MLFTNQSGNEFYEGCVFQIAVKMADLCHVGTMSVYSVKVELLLYDVFITAQGASQLLCGLWRSLEMCRGSPSQGHYPHLKVNSPG